MRVLRSAVQHAHEWLETVERERQRQGAGYMGLDHKLGEWPDCTLCAAYLNTAVSGDAAVLDGIHSGPEMHA